MRVATVSHAPDLEPVRHTNRRCNPHICVCGARDRAEKGLVFVYALHLSHADIGAALRSYQLTGDAPLAETLRSLIEATLTAILHRGIVGLRADDLATRGEIEIGKASTF